MNNKISKKYEFYLLFLLFISASIIGYIYECITTFFRTGVFFKDVGFSCLPCLPIYGFGVIMLYFLFGTPQNMRIFNKHILKANDNRTKIIRYILYFFLTSITATLFEILVGVIFEIGFNQVLWDYSYLPFNFTKYACLQVSIFWGMGATLIMRLLFAPLYNMALSMPESKLYKMVNTFLFIWILDIVFNFGYYYTTGVMFSILSLL